MRHNTEGACWHVRHLGVIDPSPDTHASAYKHTSIYVFVIDLKDRKLLKKIAYVANV